MTVPLLDSHHGKHCPKRPERPERPSFFRLSLRLPWRKRSVPEVHATASGAGDGGSFYDDAVPVMDDGRPACWLPLADKLWPPAEPVLGDQMLSQVRQQWNAFHDDAEPAAPAPWRPTAGPVFTPSSAMDTAEFRALDAAIDAVLRPVNGRSMPDQPRQAVPFGELNRKFSDGRPTPELLRQVLDGLKKLGTPEREATYRGGWQ